MADITWANKDKNATDGREKFTDSDANQVKAAVNSKVDKVTGKGLSTNDFTTTEKNKLAGIAANATAFTDADAIAAAKTNIGSGATNFSPGNHTHAELKQRNFSINFPTNANTVRVTFDKTVTVSAMPVGRNVSTSTIALVTGSTTGTARSSTADINADIATFRNANPDAYYDLQVVVTFSAGQTEGSAILKAVEV